MLPSLLGYPFVLQGFGSVVLLYYNFSTGTAVAGGRLNFRSVAVQF